MRDHDRERADHSEVCDRLDRENRQNHTYGMTSWRIRHEEAVMAGPHEAPQEEPQD